MKLPTNNEIITGCTFLTIGLLILAFLPTFSNVGWYAIFFGVAFYFFPGPQLRERYKQTEETRARWRQSAKAASSQSLIWWASPFPWALLICLVVVVFTIAT